MVYVSPISINTVTELVVFNPISRDNQASLMCHRQDDGRGHQKHYGAANTQTSDVDINKTRSLKQVFNSLDQHSQPEDNPHYRQ